MSLTLGTLETHRPSYLGQTEGTTEDLSDSDALKRLKDKLVSAAQSEWLSGQFNNRTPNSERKKDFHESKEGHPFLFDPRYLIELAEMRSGESNFSDDLENLKKIFSNTFGVDLNYFDYLNGITQEQFYKWIDTILQKLYENNVHWYDFAQELLERNSIDPSDLVEGKLYVRNAESEEKLFSLQSYIKDIQSAEHPVALRTLLLGSERLGILEQIVKAHRNWRMTYYKLDNVHESQSAPEELLKLEDKYVIAVRSLRHKLNRAKVVSAEFVSSEIKILRERFERDPRNPAEQTFMLMIGLSVVLNNMVNDLEYSVKDVVASNEKEQVEIDAVLQKARSIAISVQELVRTIKLDANSSPIDTVVQEYLDAKRKHAVQAQLEGHEA